MINNNISKKDILDLNRGPLNQNKASEVASNIINSSSANPQKPKAITDLGNGPGRLIPAGNGLTGVSNNAKPINAPSDSQLEAADRIVKGSGINNDLKLKNIPFVLNAESKPPSANAPKSTGTVNPGDNGIVGIRSYLSSYGDDADIQWDSQEGKVYVNGRNVPIAYTTDGRAYARREDVESVINESIKANPHSNYNIVNNILNSQNKLDKYIDDVRNSDDFSYDYRTDPSFIALRDYYKAEADNAVRDAISAAVARTGGYMNSNAVSSANGIRSLYDKEIMSLIPTLQQNAYERWDANRKHKQNELVAIGNIIDNLNKNYISMYGDKLSSGTSRYNTDVGADIADMDRSASTDIALKELDFNREKESNDIALEKDKLQYQKDIATADLLGSVDANHDSSVTANELDQFYISVINSPISDDTKRSLLQTINKMYGYNYYLPGDEPYEVEAAVESPADEVSNNIIGAIGNPYINGIQANAVASDVHQNPFHPNNNAANNVINTILGRNNGSPAAVVYGWDNNTVPDGSAASKSYTPSGKTTNSAKTTKTTPVKSNGGSGNSNYKYTAKTSDGLTLTWR